MAGLVKIISNDVYTDSMTMANETRRQHKSVVRLIKNYKTVLDGYGIARIEIKQSGTNKGGRPIKIYYLNEPQAKFLITLMRTSRGVTLFKENLVKEFSIMRNLLEGDKNNGKQ